MPQPAAHTDPLNARILAVSEDQIAGFHADPFGEISRLSGVSLDLVLERIRVMLEAGTIRRVRQTLLATNLAEGALVAWKVAPERLESAFDFLFQEDPFSGHVVVRSTDAATPGSEYRLWTTLKVPARLSLEQHCEVLARLIGAEKFRVMRAKGIFTLGVGHVRRKVIEPGARSERPAVMMRTGVTELTAKEWEVLMVLKRELAPEEIVANVWEQRAEEIGMGLEEFCGV
ncbi:MAG: Lrp/AsnC family transcriptional regulator, partial [Verrucomicrobiia bacterium]